MNYKILYPGAYPVVQFDLDYGDSIKAEADAMISMSSNLEIKGSVDGGLLKGIARRYLGNESFFFQTITANRSSGTAILGPPYPGGIIDVRLDGTYSLKVQKDGFLAATKDVQVDTSIQNLAQGIFSKEGFFVLNLKGKGVAFLNSYGAIHMLNLSAGEEVLIDNGHLVAWPEYMHYSIERAGNNIFASLTSGECLVCRFRGPGFVLIQTRKPLN